MLVQPVSSVLVHNSSYLCSNRCQKYVLYTSVFNSLSVQTSHSLSFSPAIILRLTLRIWSLFQYSSSVAGLYLPVPDAVSMYCSKLCAGSRDAQHNRRSVCGDKYVCVQGAIHKVPGFVAGLFTTVQVVPVVPALCF